MFAKHQQRHDFADTRAVWGGAESTFQWAGLNRTDALDVAEQLAQADAADRELLVKVIGLAAATLALALAGSWM